MTTTPNEASAAEGLPGAGGPSLHAEGPIHLRGGGVSLVLTRPDLAAGAQPPLPEVLHWGPALPVDIDLGDLSAMVGRAIPHSAPDQALVRRLLPVGADGWRLRPGLRGSRPDGTAHSPRFAVTSLDASTPGSVLLRAVDDAASLEVAIELTLDEHGVLILRQTLTNAADTTYLLAELGASLPLPPRASEVLDLAGRWCRERSPQRHPLPIGTWSRESRHGRTGHDAAILTHVGVPGFGFGRGEVWAVHLGWSGDATVWVERDAAGFAQVGAAELLAPGELRLGPGQSYAAPPLYAVYGAAGMDSVSQALHAHVRARPTHPPRPRPVLLNTWEAVYFDHRLDRLTALADAAAAAGVERFVLDDGWFGGRRHDRAGLGDWVVSADQWPDGLGPLITHVRALGMEFGLWVEPEMVNLDSDLVRAHPDWVLGVAGRLPMSWRHQQVLDLANPDAFAHILERLDALLRENDIAFLKWDHNRDLVDAAHGGAAAVHGQTLAVYRLLDELRERHPGVEIETCASGGGRVDLGILARTDRLWASDTIDAHERAHIQRWTGSLVPPELVGAHIGSGVAHTTGRRHTLAFRAGMALFGHLGIEADLTAVDEVDRRRIADAVAQHKRLRPLLHTGSVVRLDDVDDSAMAHGVVAADRSAAVFSYAQLTSSPTEVPAMFRLRGLDPGAAYRVLPLAVAGGATTQQIAPPPWVHVTGGLVVPGAVLMDVGLALPILHPEQVLLVELTRVG
ncbi:MAG: alpha-galactosidase [Actinomycetales bacterium]|nr:alpha-galactosidase [Candidatus Lutibacillus vidarii]